MEQDSEIPRLPIKLPPKLRKKLSIEFENNHASLKFDEIIQSKDIDTDNDEAFTSQFYIDPVEKHPTKFEKRPADSNTYLSFLNETLYKHLSQVVSLNNSNESNLNESDDSLEKFPDYLSLELLHSVLDDENNENYSKSNKSTVDSSNNNDVKHFDLEEKNDVRQDIPDIPPIPPKRTKILNRLSPPSNFSDLNKKTTSIIRNNSNSIDTSLTRINLANKNDYSIDDFKKEIFKKEENKICADCKRIGYLPEWISCVYFITLCKNCAEIHMKLSHTINKFYLIDIDNLYEDLIEESFFVDVESFLHMLDLAGNEKINSLLEFQVKEAREINLSKSPEVFIKEKYVNKKFINTNEIDLSGNFIDELNRLVFNSVTGPSLSMTIYYLFLGASLNTHVGEQSLLEQALSFERLQALYLLFQKQNFTSQLNEFEFIGEANQIIDFSTKSLKRSQIYLKLTHNNEIFIIYQNNRVESIKLETVIRVFSCDGSCNTSNLNDRIIEIKWLNKSNRSIISTFFEFFNTSEKQLWMKKIFLKLLDERTVSKLNKSRLDLSLECCQINSMGFLNQHVFGNGESNKEERTFLVLVETLETQIEIFFEKTIVLINMEDSGEVDQEPNRSSLLSNFAKLDVRKLVRLKLDTNEMGNRFIIIDTPLCIRKFQSVNGYSENLSIWYEKLNAFRQLEFRSIEEQFTNKEGCPLILDKLCSFIEIYFLTDEGFYSSFGTNSDNKKLKALFSSLESEREFNLTQKNVKTPNVILGLFKIYFAKYLNQENSEKRVTDYLKQIKDFNVLDHKSSMLFQIIKRLAIHLSLISKYEYLNKHSLMYLVKLFEGLILGRPQNGFSLNLDSYVNNCQTMFELSNDFFQYQYNIVDKLISLKNSKTTSFLKNKFKFKNYLIRVYLNDKSSTQSFQILIDSKVKAGDLLLQAKQEFKIENLNEFSLFEVIDSQQTDSLLERILPVNSFLINTLSNWNSFYYAIKFNYMRPETKGEWTVTSFFDACYTIGACEQCLKSSNSNCCNRKWKSSYITVQNANIKLFSKLKNKQDFEEFNLSNSRLILDLNIEDSLVYYGMYENDYLKNLNTVQINSDDLNGKLLGSVSKIFSTQHQIKETTDQFIFNKEHCLTLYDLNNNSINLICFNSKQKTFIRYFNLFKLAYFSDNCFYNNSMIAESNNI